ncbi:MAG: enoyl-CoA hydratase [Bacteroidia bacterium]|jgi:enoyl-CoA hydratase
MTFQYIRTDLANHIYIISINREDKMNALNATLLKEIKSAVMTATDDDDVYGIIITGVGKKAFAAGADIAEFQNFSKEEGRQLSADGHEVMNTIEQSLKPVIAAVNGFALGGGCELAMACHMRVATPNAKFGQPEVNLGLIPGYGGTQRLIQLIGKGKAIEMLTTADMVAADEALRLGLVNHVVDQAELMEKCFSIINKIAIKSPQGIAKTMECVQAYFDSSKDGMAVEIDHFGSCFATDEFKEGTTSFFEKRRANYRK